MKYLLLCLSLCLSASAIAQDKKKHAPKPKVEVKSIESDTKGMEPGIAELSNALPSPPPQIYTFVEQMPQPTVDIATFIGKNLHYPDSARNSGAQGMVAVAFVVEEDGTLSNVRTVRGIGYGCDEEAIRVIKSMPRWIPGKQSGKTVKVNNSQLVRFVLH